MNVTEARDVRSAAALLRADMRDEAAASSAAQSDLRRDQRVEDSKETDATRTRAGDYTTGDARSGRGLYLNILV